MIRAQHRLLYLAFFRFYTRTMIARYFSRVDIHSGFTDQHRPVLMIGNHFSWWDGFIAYLINMRIIHRKFHIMMLEDQLRGRSFLNKAGAFSIRKGSRSVLESLGYAAGLLKQDDNLVVIYPQGSFQSVHAGKITFEPGIRILAGNIDRPVHLLFYAALVDYFQEKKPALTIYLREYDYRLISDPERLEAEYNRFYQECAQQQVPR